MTDKIYRFGGDLINTIDVSEYNNGDIIMYDIQDIPLITIHNWEDVKASDKLQISAKANAGNWTDLTPNI